MSELKPCPYCGKTPRAHVDRTDPEEPRTDVWVCRNTASMPRAGQYHAGISHWCGLVHVEVDCHDTDKGEAVRKVRDAWNTRHMETCRMEPLNAFYTDLNGLNQTEWGVCSNCGTASPIDATYCCECGRKVER